jgi:hypothetical protein
MRNKIPFGYTPFGGQILVKLNVKLSNRQALDLVKKYSGLCTWDNGKYGQAIEGIVHHSRLDSFLRDFHIVKLDAKIERLMDQKTKFLDDLVTDSDIINNANFDEL